MATPAERGGTRGITVKDDRAIFRWPERGRLNTYLLPRMRFAESHAIRRVEHSPGANPDDRSRTPQQAEARSPPWCSLPCQQWPQSKGGASRPERRGRRRGTTDLGTASG